MLGFDDNALAALPAQSVISFWKNHIFNDISEDQFVDDRLMHFILLW